MADKKRVIAYYDGSNFYHAFKSNYGITNVNFLEITNQTMNQNYEKLVKIKYFNSPLNQQEEPQKYAKQQKFLAKLKNTDFVEVLLGNLVKRPLNKININCKTCGHQRANCIKCPECNKELHIKCCFRYTEKGVDVKLAINLLLDALENKYDTAFLFSGDADFSPVIEYVTKKLNKRVIYCYFPNSRTYELIQVCSNSKLITRRMVEEAQISI